MRKNAGPGRGASSLAAALLAAVSACAPQSCGPRTAPVELAIACDDSEADVDRAPASLPPFEDSRRGEVVRCGHVGRPERTPREHDDGPREDHHGASFVRLAYRTTRAEPALPHDAVAGALLIVPERLRDPDVLVVVAHGTSGFGERCTPSRGPMSALSRRLANEGWMSVLPDDAGYGYGARPAGWISADDEARSIFDAIRAVHHALPEGHRPKRVVLIGHSQGGHAVLAAQAAARADDLPAQIIGVAASAALWFPPLLFARMVTHDEKSADAGTRDLLWALYYFYGHAELEEGPGSGIALIHPGLRASLGDALKGGCNLEVESVLAGLAPSEVFAADFLEALRTCDEGGACSLEATRWMQRFGRDWPELDPKGAPVLWLQGGHDTHVTLPRARCAMDRLIQSLPAAKLTICGDATATHMGELTEHLDDIMTWVAHRARHEPGRLSCDAAKFRRATAGASCPIEADGRAKPN